MFLFSVMTSHDSAQESSDYVRIERFITIPAGETCQPVTIQILSDTAVESDEEFYLSVSFSPMLSTLVYIIDGHGSTNVTIKDDDGKSLITYFINLTLGLIILICSYRKEA